MTSRIFYKIATNSCDDLTKQELQIIAFDHYLSWNDQFQQWILNNSKYKTVWTMEDSRELKRSAFLKIVEMQERDKMYDSYNNQYLHSDF